jgi:hypothetical protein
MYMIPGQPLPSGGNGRPEMRWQQVAPDPENPGQLIYQGDVQKHQVKGFFDFNVNAGSSLPFVRERQQQRFEKFMGAINANPYDPCLEEYGKLMEIENAKRLIAKAQEQADKMKQEQAPPPQEPNVVYRYEELPPRAQLNALIKAGLLPENYDPTQDNLQPLVSPIGRNQLMARKQDLEEVKVQHGIANPPVPAGNGGGK